jgi:hypothetical protein
MTMLRDKSEYYADLIAGVAKLKCKGEYFLPKEVLEKESTAQVQNFVPLRVHNMVGRDFEFAFGGKVESIRLSRDLLLFQDFEENYALTIEESKKANENDFYKMGIMGSDNLVFILRCKLGCFRIAGGIVQLQLSLPTGFYSLIDEDYSVVWLDNPTEIYEVEMSQKALFTDYWPLVTIQKMVSPYSSLYMFRYDEDCGMVASFITLRDLREGCKRMSEEIGVDEEVEMDVDLIDCGWSNYEFVVKHRPKDLDDEIYIESEHVEGLFVCEDFKILDDPFSNMERPTELSAVRNNSVVLKIEEACDSKLEKDLMIKADPLGIEVAVRVQYGGSSLKGRMGGYLKACKLLMYMGGTVPLEGIPYSAWYKKEISRARAKYKSRRPSNHVLLQLIRSIKSLGYSYLFVSPFDFNGRLSGEFEPFIQFWNKSEIPCMIIGLVTELGMEDQEIVRYKKLQVVYSHKRRWRVMNIPIDPSYDYSRMKPAAESNHGLQIEIEYSGIKRFGHTPPLLMYQQGDYLKDCDGRKFKFY